MQESLSRFGPELALIASVVVILLGDLLLRDRSSRRVALLVLALLGLAAAAVALALLPTGDRGLFSGMIVNDGLARYGKGLFLCATALGVAFGAVSTEIPEERYGEYLLLLLSLALGLCLLAASRHLLMLYLALELVSLPSYVLAGFRRGDRRTSEAALKYVVYGGAASGVMLYGFSLLYGLTGTLDLARLGGAVAAVAEESGSGRFALVATFVLSLAGFTYKISAVPFHL